MKPIFLPTIILALALALAPGPAVVGGLTNLAPTAVVVHLHWQCTDASGNELTSGLIDNIVPPVPGSDYNAFLFAIALPNACTLAQVYALSVNLGGEQVGMSEICRRNPARPKPCSLVIQPK